MRYVFEASKDLVLGHLCQILDNQLAVCHESITLAFSILDVLPAVSFEPVLSLASSCVSKVFIIV